MDLKDLEKVRDLAADLAALRIKIKAIRESNKVSMMFFVVDPYAADGKVETQDYPHPSDLGTLFRDLRARTLEYYFDREAATVANLKALGVIA